MSKKQRRPRTRLEIAIAETREWMEINSDPDATDEDALESLMGDCGNDGSGYCSKAGSEECDWECPFS